MPETSTLDVTVAPDPTMPSADPTSAHPTGLLLLTVGFGTAVAMWAIGYISRIPPVLIPSPVVGVLFVGILAAGGYIAAKTTGRGASGGARAGAITGLVNLLVLGSLISGEDGGVTVPSLAIWVPGSLLGGAALGAIGGFLGRAYAPCPQCANAQGVRAAFGYVGIVATFFTVIAGGLVTSFEAGLAVPDWPNSFGSNMFLYPLAKMTGGIYYEHAHRLYGALVGLTTVVFTIVLLRGDRDPAVKKLALLATAMVITQGLMGGVRVTGSLTMAEQPATEPNTVLAIIHGTFGQIFLMTMVILAVLVTPAFRRAVSSNDKALRMALPLVIVLVAQLAMGAMARHLSTEERPLHLMAMCHMTFAVVVALKTCLVGLRAREDSFRWIVRTLGTGLLAIVGVQVVLGVAAMVAVLFESDPPTALQALVAPAHQANGALLLGSAGALAVWARRPRPSGAVPAPA